MKRLIYLLMLWPVARALAADPNPPLQASALGRSLVRQTTAANMRTLIGATNSDASTLLTKLNPAATNSLRLQGGLTNSLTVWTNGSFFFQTAQSATGLNPLGGGLNWMSQGATIPVDASTPMASVRVWDNWGGSASSAISPWMLITCPNIRLEPGYGAGYGDLCLGNEDAACSVYLNWNRGVTLSQFDTPNNIGFSIPLSFTAIGNGPVGNSTARITVMPGIIGVTSGTNCGTDGSGNYLGELWFQSRSPIRVAGGYAQNGQNTFRSNTVAKMHPNSWETFGNNIVTGGQFVGDGGGLTNVTATLSSTVTNVLRLQGGLTNSLSIWTNGAWWFQTAQNDGTQNPMGGGINWVAQNSQIPNESLYTMASIRAFDNYRSAPSSAISPWISVTAPNIKLAPGFNSQYGDLVLGNETAATSVYLNYNYGVTLSQYSTADNVGFSTPLGFVADGTDHYNNHYTIMPGIIGVTAGSNAPAYGGNKLGELWFQSLVPIRVNGGYAQNGQNTFYSNTIAKMHTNSWETFGNNIVTGGQFVGDGGGITNLQNTALQFPTNTTGTIPAFSLTGSLAWHDLTTNATFQFLAPSGVSSTNYQTCVILVTNSAASTIQVIAPAKVYTNGVWNVTNAGLTKFEFFNNAGRWTNAVATPIK